MLLLVFAAFGATAASAHAQAAPAPSASPNARQTLAGAWWTGPLLAPSAGTLPRGHILVEPYVYDVIQYGSYDGSGTLKSSAHSNALGSLTYLIYGLADRESVGVIPTFGYNSVSRGRSSSGIGFGDLAVLAQYRLALYRAGSWVPTTSVAVQESFPTGAYDRLANPSDGFGSGAHTTTVSLYTQTYFWMPNGRILRVRLNASQAFSSTASIEGASVYGTSTKFTGYAKPGNTFTLDEAEEYSITRNWVFAMDLVYHHSANTQVIDSKSVTNSGDATAYQFAPAFEYNWTENAGIIIGARLTPAGSNTSASFTPVMAVNLVR